MAIDLTTDSVASGYNLSVVNGNFSKTETALQDGLSRTGSGPNSMEVSIDMNGNTLLNLPAPVNPNDPVRFQDVAAGDKNDAEAAAAAALVSETNAAASEDSASNSATQAAAAEKSIGWVFDTSTTMSDPGDSNVRLNNATLSSVTSIAVDRLDFNTSDVSDYVATWGASTATNKGVITLRKAESVTDFAIYNITTAVTDNSGWLQLTVSHVTSSGTFSADDTAFLHFTRSGDDGLTGGGSGDLLASNNLSDVASASTSRTNLGLAPLAVQSSVAVGQLNNVTVGTPQLIDNGVTLGKMAVGTPGGFMAYDTTTGALVDIGAGTAGQIPQSNGAGVITWVNAPSAGADTLHDLVSTSAVTMNIAASSTPSDVRAGGKVIATKASVSLKTTDRISINVKDMILDASGVGTDTRVRIWVKINSVHSYSGFDDNGGEALPINGKAYLLTVANTAAGTVDTFSKSGHLGSITLLASDFISSNASHTIDIMAVADAGDAAVVIDGATTTTTFNLRVEA